MRLLTLVLSCTIAGSFACTVNKCQDPVVAYQLETGILFPDKEGLKTLCPKTITFLECQKDFLECGGQSIEELTTSSDKSTATKAKANLAAMGLFRDVCDEDSSLHNDYIASVSCYREYFIEAAGSCREKVTKPVQDFFDQFRPDADEDDINETALVEFRCLRNTYEVVCLLDSIGESCGIVAERTVRNALERFKGILGDVNCQQLSNLADLKSRFLDFLELDEERKIRAQGIFDLTKGRR